MAEIDSYVNSNLVPNATAYRWRITTLNGPNANLVQTTTTGLRQVRITSLVTYAFNTQYKVEVSAMVGGVWGPYGTSCNVSTPATQTQLAGCGSESIAVANMSDAIYANNVPFAAGYRFRITDPLNPANTQEIQRSLREFRLSQVTAFIVQYNKVYNVQVSIKNTDGTYLPFVTTCTIKTPIFPTTGLQDSQCDDYIVPTRSTPIYAVSYPGAIAYVFRLTGPGLPEAGVEITKQLRSFTLNDFPAATGGTYVVRVRLVFNAGEPAGPFGKTCSIVVIPAASKEVSSVKAVFSAVAYPNPFAENFNIDVTTAVEDKVTVRVYDMTGRLLEEHVNQVSQMETLSVGDRYPSGVYNVIVTQGDNAKTLRVIKR